MEDIVGHLMDIMHMQDLNIIKSQLDTQTKPFYANVVAGSNKIMKREKGLGYSFG